MQRLAAQVEEAVLEPPLLVHRLVLVGREGRAIGSLGVDPRDRHLDLEQRVAIKLMLPSGGDNSDAAARFLRDPRNSNSGEPALSAVRVLAARQNLAPLIGYAAWLPSSDAPGWLGTTRSVL